MVEKKINKILVALHILLSTVVMIQKTWKSLSVAIHPPRSGSGPNWMSQAVSGYQSGKATKRSVVTIKDLQVFTAEISRSVRVTTISKEEYKAVPREWGQERRKFLKM